MEQSVDMSDGATSVSNSGRRRVRKAEAGPDLGGAAVASGGDVEQHIYQTVFDSVLNQRLTPGTKLPEPALCELFGVSRAVIRKVLQRLEHERIVELRPNKGAVIAAPTPEETRQIFEARRALEVSIVEIAARRHTAKDLADLRKLLAHEHEVTHNLYQPAWAACAREFHLRIAAVAGNPILTNYLTELMTRCSLIVALYQPTGNAACEHAEHGRIVDYMEKGDVASARAEMGRHLRALEDNISLDRGSSTQSLAQMLNLG
ncbi:GntR family transcriptional regulator [Novosphingobium resinovorum]|uniref:GntR family transcriptional regulator n=1 Tax=Novosphingobium resinovorum TaxID=158500 RepID=UPI002ED6643E|nr:GntR family transcriptional regulator [Novosphingobium resinovorum]